MEDRFLEDDREEPDEIVISCLVKYKVKNPAKAWGHIYDYQLQDMISDVVDLSECEISNLDWDYE